MNTLPRLEACEASKILGMNINTICKLWHECKLDHRNLHSTTKTRMNAFVAIPGRNRNTDLITQPE